MRPADKRPLRDKPDDWLDRFDRVGIEPRDAALMAVVLRHFPSLNPESVVVPRHRVTVERLCEAFDQDIRHALNRAGRMVPGRGKRPSQIDRCFEAESLSLLVGRMLAAIDAHDADAYWKASSTMTREQYTAYIAHWRAVTGEPGHELIDLSIEKMGPAPLGAYPAEVRDRAAGFWSHKSEALRRTLAEAKLPGRRPSGAADEALRELIDLWSTLSGQEAGEPWNDAGRCAAPWLNFVREASRLYADVGLYGAADLNSRSGWRRILAAK